MSLKATNAWARIAHMRSALAAFDRYLKERGSIEPVFFVSIAPSHLAFNFDQEQPNWERDRFDTSTMFAKAHSFGALDVAYYGNVNTTGNIGTTMLSLHGHHLVWGMKQKELEELKGIYNSRKRSALPPSPAFDFIPARLKEHIIYLSKAPTREYRRDRRSLEEVRMSSAGGAGGRAGLWKRDLRPKDAAKMSNLLADVTIPNWIVCTGDGIQLAQEVSEDTARRLEQDQAARLARFRSLLSM